MSRSSRSTRRSSQCRPKSAVPKMAWYAIVADPKGNIFARGDVVPSRAAAHLAEGEPGFLGWETTGKRGLAVAASDSHPMAYCLVWPETTDTGAATTPVQPVCTRSKGPNQGVIGTCV